MPYSTHLDQNHFLMMEIVTWNIPLSNGKTENSLLGVWFLGGVSHFRSRPFVTGSYIYNIYIPECCWLVWEQWISTVAVPCQGPPQVPAGCAHNSNHWQTFFPSTLLTHQDAWHKQRNRTLHQLSMSCQFSSSATTGMGENSPTTYGLHGSPMKTWVTFYPGCTAH